MNSPSLPEILSFQFYFSHLVLCQPLYSLYLAILKIVSSAYMPVSYNCICKR